MLHAANRIATLPVKSTLALGSIFGGRMAERTIALVLKTNGPSRVPGVRIPLLPPKVLLVGNARIVEHGNNSEPALNDPANSGKF